MNKKTKMEVIKRDGLICQYCLKQVIYGSASSKGLVIEHVFNRSESINNLCVACRKCNSTKGKKSADEWAEHLLNDYEKAVQGLKIIGNIADLKWRLKHAVKD